MPHRPAGISYVEIGSSDLDRSVDFYRSLLDLRPVDDVPWPSGDRSRWLGAGPVLVKLVDAGDGDLGGWVNDDLQRGMRHVGLKVGDVDLRAERVRDAGVPFTIEPTDAVGDVRLAFFQDPDGTLLELIDGHLHYHRTMSPELAERERAAAAERPREAIPVFDHVAVTVADLDATVAFYTDTFGYEVIGQLVHEQDPRGFLITYLQAGAGVLELFTFTAGTRPSPWTPDPHRLGLRAVALGVDEVDMAADRVLQAGGKPVEGDGEVGRLLTDRDGIPLRAVSR